MFITLHQICYWCRLPDRRTISFLQWIFRSKLIFRLFLHQPFYNTYTILICSRNARTAKAKGGRSVTSVKAGVGSSATVAKGPGTARSTWERARSRQTVHSARAAKNRMLWLCNFTGVKCSCFCPSMNDLLWLHWSYHGSNNSDRNLPVSP